MNLRSGGETVGRKSILSCLAAVGIIAGILAKVMLPVAVTSSGKESIEVAVIMYHHVTEDSYYFGRDSISIDELECDLQTLKAMGYNTVHLSQLYDYVDSSSALPPNPIVLTFDDGFLNYKDIVVPLLEKYNCKATVAITGEYADNAADRVTNDPDFEYMSWEELGKLDKYYTEIAYHSYYSHVLSDPVTGRRGMKKLSSESNEEYKKYLTDELQKFAMRLNDIDGQTVIVAYPFGSYSDSTDGIMQSLGMKITLTCESGINCIRCGDYDSLLSMKRINRPHGISSEMFFVKNLSR